MNTNQFWQKATDYYNIYHGKYRHDLLTDDELRDTVIDYLGDMMVLMGEWYSGEQPNSNNAQEYADNDNSDNDNS